MDVLGQASRPRELLLAVEAGEEALQPGHVGGARPVLSRGQAPCLEVVGGVEDEGGDPAETHGLVGRVQVDGDEEIRVDGVRVRCAILQAEDHIRLPGQDHPGLG